MAATISEPAGRVTARFTRRIPPIPASIARAKPCPLARAKDAGGRAPETPEPASFPTIAGRPSATGNGPGVPTAVELEARALRSRKNCGGEAGTRSSCVARIGPAVAAIPAPTVATAAPAIPAASDAHGPGNSAPTRKRRRRNLTDDRVLVPVRKAEDAPDGRARFAWLTLEQIALGAAHGRQTRAAHGSGPGSKKRPQPLQQKCRTCGLMVNVADDACPSCSQPMFTVISSEGGSVAV